jgi:cytochrome c oxidase subunit 4
MSESRRKALRRIVAGPFLSWIGLCLLLGTTTGLAYLPMGSMNLAVSLAIAAAKVSIIAIVFMELSRAAGVVRLASIVGIFWLAFLFLLIFTDYLSR